MVAPLGELLAAQAGFDATQAGHDHETALRQAHAAIREHDPKIARAARNNQTSWQTVDDLLTAMDGGDGSSKPSMVPLEGLELKSRPFSTADFAEKPRKIKGFGVNVIVQNRLVCPQVWANGGQRQFQLTVGSGFSYLHLDY
jgi:hypothetical protein